jgi:lipopolysaccharide transport system permease protein
MQVLKDLWRSRGLLWVLTKREIAARFAGSAGGMLWAWVQPILNIAAYYLVFDVVFAMRMGEHAPTDRVGTFLIVGMLAWMSFSEAVQRGMSSLVEAGGILQKNPLPPVLFPARAVLASALIYAPLLLGLVLAYWPKHHGSPAVVAMLPLVLSQVLLAWLLGYLLAILMAALRDVQQIVAFVMSIGVFAAPILFPLTMFPERWRWLLWLNPMTAWVLGYQAILLQGRWPDWHVWVTMGVWLVVAACLLALALRRSRDQLVDWL